MTLEDAVLFVSVLQEFKFFADYMTRLTDLDWLALGLGCVVKKYPPFKPICRIWDPSKTVYFNLEGDIGVVLERFGTFTKEIMDEHSVAVLKPGVSIGEIGVLYNSNRTASCIALTDVYVIAIDQGIYQKILGDYVRDMNEMRIRVLSNLKLFQNWDRISLVGLLKHLYLRSPKHSSYIYRAGEVNQNIYIVAEGELEIVADYD